MSDITDVTEDDLKRFRQATRMPQSDVQLLEHYSKAKETGMVESADDFVKLLRFAAEIAEFADIFNLPTEEAIRLVYGERV